MLHRVCRKERLGCGLIVREVGGWWGGRKRSKVGIWGVRGRMTK